MNDTTTVGIEVRADGTQEAARDLAVVEASIRKVGKGLGEAAQYIGSAKLEKPIAGLDELAAKCNVSSRHMQNLARMMREVERERAFRQLAQDANLSTLQLARLRAEMGDMRGALATLGNKFSSAKVAILAWAAAVAFGGKACLDAALQMDRLDKSYTSIYGSASAAQQQLSYLYDVSGRLGLQFQSTAEGAKTFFAAGRGSTLEKDLNSIFEAVSSAGTALSLSTDDMHGAFIALGQMISKGKVQAEELRGQLGERLPGAFQLAAKAMGMTTAALDKFMADGKLTAEELLPKLAKVLKDEYGAAAEEAAKGMQGSLNRLSTEWERLKASFVDSDTAVAGINALRVAVEGLQALFDALSEYSGLFKALAVGAGVSAGVAVLAAALKTCLPLLALFKGALDVNAALTFAGGVMGIQKAMIALRAAMIAHPVLAFAAVLGTVAAVVSYLVGEYGAEAEKLKILDGAQETAAASAKALANAHKMSAQELANYIAKLEEQEEKLKNVEEGIRARLSEQGFYGLEKMDTGNEYVIAAYERFGEALPMEQLNQFEQALEEAKASALQTSDWRALIAELDKIEREAKASGDYTDLLRTAIENARAAARDGITFNIRISEVHEVVTRYLEEQAQRNKSPNVLAAEMEEKQRQREIRELVELKNDYLKHTDEGRLEALRQQRTELEKQLGLLGSSSLTQQEQNEKAHYLNAQLTTTNQKIDSILKKGQRKDNSLEQAQRNLDAYNAELGKIEASIASLRAQLATKPGEIFTREQAKIAAEYETTLKQIDKQAADYARKKGISTEQANQIKQQKQIEASLQRDLKLREAQEKEEKRLAELARDKYEFYKELEELTGQYGLSLKYQNEAIAAQVKELERLEIPQEYINQWRELKELQASHDWADGARRTFLQYRADATDAAKGAEEAFSSLYSGMDSGWKSAWEQMIETGKVSLSSFRSVFASFLADLMHMAITRPITVQIAGVVSGVLGTGGVAYAAGGSGSSSGGTGGLLGNIPFSSILPDSWTSGAAGLFSGITGGINSFASNLTGGFFASSATEAQFNALANSITGGWGVGGSTLLGTLGAAGAGFGLGSLAGSLLFPNQPNISTGAGIGGGLGAAIGSVVPGIGTLLGGTIGSLLGGGIGSLFGGGRRTHASVYGKMEDVGFSRDQQTYIDAFMGGAWYDRSGKKEAEPFAQGIAQVASQTAGSLLDIAGALPEQIRQSALSGLETSTWSAGRGVSDASWNFQWWEEGMAEERLEEAAKDMRNRMTAVAQQVFSNAGISRFFDSFDVTTDEGLQKASTALSAISAVKSATDAIKSPLSEMEQQAQSAKAQLDAWTQGMKDSGVNAQYAAGLINEYRNAFINDYIKTLDESLHPLSAYAQAVKTANEAVDQRKKALEIIGATEGQLAQVEAMRAEVVRQATEEMLRSFDQSVAQRWAAVNGNSDEVGRAISQANELRETIQQFGEGSAQVAELLKLHAAETAKAAEEVAKAAQDAAKSEYDSLRAQMDALEQQRVQLQQQAIQEQINAINEQLSAAKTLKSTWEGLDKSLGQSRYNLFAGSANLDAENRLGTVQAEFRRLSGLALGGDSDAAGQLVGVGNSLLDLVKQTAGTEEEYLDAFWAVNAQLKAAQEAAGAQVSAADKQLEALQGQLDVQNAALKQLQGQSATLEEIEKQIAELKPLLDAAGDKAGVKAFARGGLALPGWAVVGEEGPELVNFSQPGRVYTAADTAALFRSVTPRAADTDSGSDAEVKALRREVYQLRRDMLISMSEIARFSRRTSDMVEAWDAEGMPGVRA